MLEDHRSHPKSSRSTGHSEEYATTITEPRFLFGSFLGNYLSQISPDAIPPDFKPIGSMKRMQKVIEMVYLDDEDDCEFSMDDLLVSKKNWKQYSDEVRVKAENIIEKKSPSESFKQDDCSHSTEPWASAFVASNIKLEQESDDDIGIIEVEDEKRFARRRNLTVENDGSKVSCHVTVDSTLMFPQPVVIVPRLAEKRKSGYITRRTEPGTWKFQKVQLTPLVPEGRKTRIPRFQFPVKLSIKTRIPTEAAKFRNQSNAFPQPTAFTDIRPPNGSAAEIITKTHN